MMENPSEVELETVSGNRLRLSLYAGRTDSRPRLPILGRGRQVSWGQLGSGGRTRGQSGLGCLAGTRLRLTGNDNMESSQRLRDADLWYFS